ncbi:MAG: ROK family protein [Anaerolineae bacterium]
MSILAIDFGGTRTRAAWYDESLKQFQRHETLSHVEETPQAVIERIIAVARRVIPADAQPTVIGVAAPGPLDPQRGVILHAKTLQGWAEVPLAQRLSEGLGGIPTYIENDANLAALAEYGLGAGRGADPMVYMTISTGIGGGAVIGGRLFTGWSKLAIEPGHMRFMLPDGSIRRLEEIASGTGIANTARRIIQHSDSPASPLRTLPAEQLTGEAVGAAAVKGDALALTIIEEVATYLGLGFANLLHLLSPEAIVVGGSVTKLGALLFEPALRVMRENLLDAAFLPPTLLRAAHFGEDVCLHGAALYAKQKRDQA